MTLNDVTVEEVVINGVKHTVVVEEPTEEVKAEVNSDDKIIDLLDNNYIANSTISVLGSLDVNVSNATAEELAPAASTTATVEETKSDKTGTPYAVTVMALLAIVSLAGLTFVNRKEVR